jgi:anthranilate phosphoribosyltransferase
MSVSLKSPPERLASYVATLGRGPGRSRALTREEARDAFSIVLSGEADPHQVGALLMLLRYRGEDPDEIAGLVEAARSFNRVEGMRPADLDWPSYGAGRTRGFPWYLLAALTLARAGHRIVMHGSNEFSSGVTVEEALVHLAPLPENFTYLPTVRINPPLARLLGLRALLGLRSPANTVGRLLNPCNAPVIFDGVFHPPYIELHLAVAERLGQSRIGVLKGSGGEAERNPGRTIALHIADARTGRRELSFTPLATKTDVNAERPSFIEWREIWRGHRRHERAEATVTGTIAAALTLLDPALTPAAADSMGRHLWECCHQEGNGNDRGSPRRPPKDLASESTLRRA